MIEFAARPGERNAVLSKVWMDAVCGESEVSSLAASLELPLAIARALVARGIKDPAAADRYLNPRLSDLSDPFQLKGMAEAVDRIALAIRQNQAILVYGDYDVDGVTASALLVHVLSRLGGVVTPFLPNRMEDGYGLGVATATRCIDSYHPQLIVTVDCGTGSAEAVRYAASRGVDVVVTDHHQPADEIAPAVAVVNPKIGGSDAVQMLAGVGVAFKLCHALLRRAREENWPDAASIDLRQYLDYVALGTIADIVPLLHENRILSHHGLALLNQTQSIGLKGLIETAGIKGEIDSYHVGCVLGPRINAAGRIGDPQQALELLLTDHPPRARNLAMQLDAANRDRQKIEGQIVLQAAEMIDAFFDPVKHFGLVVASRGWHTGVIGIVASRLCARYRRPIIVVGLEEDGVGRGSCRSIEGFDLLRHLVDCSDLLLNYGGHSMAAGIEVKRGELDTFRKRFNALATETLKTMDLRPVQMLDAWIRMDEIDDELMSAQDRMRPFGHCNPNPVWAVRGVRVAGVPRIVGKNHVKMTLAGHGTQRDAIAFGMAERNIPDSPLDVAFQLQRNTYMGNTVLQMNVQDFRPSA